MGIWTKTNKRGGISTISSKRPRKPRFIVYLGLVGIGLEVSLPVLQDLSDVDALEQVLEECPEPACSVVGGGIRRAKRIAKK